MKISTEPPPNWKELEKAFGVSFDDVCVTWGDTAHIKSGFMSKDLEAHEMTHSLQQAHVGGPRKWFTRYMKDEKFRFEQELQAYRNQAMVLRKMYPDRNHSMLRIAKLARDLSGSMYGGIASYGECLKKILA